MPSTHDEKIGRKIPLSERLSNNLIIGTQPITTVHTKIQKGQAQNLFSYDNSMNDLHVISMVFVRKEIV